MATMTQRYFDKRVPLWASFSLLINGIFLFILAFALLRDKTAPSTAQVNPPINASGSLSPQLGERYQLNYEEWVALLSREAAVMAAKQPKRLTILLGDSLSLWFPTNLLPTDRIWLNQGISGETSFGLLNRLQVVDRTRPETILIMIGINDLIKGLNDQAVLDNQVHIIRYLKRMHPQSQIVLQSILPHAASRATWEGRNRLQTMPNSRIRNLNRELAAIARTEGIYYLDLHTLFTDPEGNLRPELTTDGLHLSQQGYWVWRSALQLFSQLELEQSIH